jgi:hypothetical protein
VKLVSFSFSPSCFRHTCTVLFLTTLLLSGVPVSPTAVDSSNLRAAFQIRSTTVWPTTETAFDQIKSTFGPRIKPSTNDSDWHRSADIDAP